MVLADSPSSRRTVLVVDDDDAMRESLADILDQDYTVLLAADGEEALRQVARQPVDVLILDMAMPKCDGLSVLQALGPPPPKVIVLSAFAYYGSEDIQQTGLGAKVTRALRKPAPPTQLLAAVHDALYQS
ncbi:MAG TPA: response regulator [Acidimicrobiales bacterium]|nr:response regulator [Acidimicrobiales bacterium]